jgi:hypothetical protein
LRWRLGERLYGADVFKLLPAREQSGRPSGRDLEFWLQAEREFREAEDIATALLLLSQRRPSRFSAFGPRKR